MNGSLGGAERIWPVPIAATPLMVPCTSVPVWVSHDPVLDTKPLPVPVDMTSNDAAEP